MPARQRGCSLSEGRAAHAPCKCRLPLCASQTLVAKPKICLPGKDLCACTPRLTPRHAVQTSTGA